MARHTFAYRVITVPPSPPFPNGQTLARAHVLTQLTGSNGNSIKAVSCVDSGADGCAFPMSFALALKLDPLKMERNTAGGVGNSSNIVYYDKIKLEVGNIDDFLASSMTTFVPLIVKDIHAGFTTGLDASGIGLLGHTGFLDSCIATFDQRNLQFHLDI